MVGQVGRDLVLRVRELPEQGGSAPVLERRELLGGKGANQAVALTQLGAPVALAGVVGADDAGADVLTQAAADGIDTSCVVRRGETALLVDVVDAPGSRRLLEHVPPPALLTPADVRAAAPVLSACDTLVLQLQQPAEALLVALDEIGSHVRLVLDGSLVDEQARRALLTRADVVRADAQEAELLLGRAVPDVAAARAATAELLDSGPRLVALAVAGQGDLVTWPGGEVLLPLTGDVLDPTGAGDAFVAGLVAALRRGADPQRAAHVAASCARSTVGRLGGRPALDPALLD